MTFVKYESRSDVIRAQRFSTRVLKIVVIVMLIGFFCVPNTAHATGDLKETLSVDIDFGSSVTFRLETPWDQPPPKVVSILFGLSEGLGRKRAAADFRVRDGLLTALTNWSLSGSLAPGSEVEYWFEIDGNSGLIKTSASSFTYLNQDFPWHRAREGLVEIWSYTEDRDMVEGIRRGIHDALSMLDTDFGLRLKRPTRLVIYNDAERMRDALGTGTRPWVGAAASSSSNVMVMHVSEHLSESDEVGSVIAHELTHVVVDHATRNPFGYVPAWLHEGLATIAESSVFKRFEYDEVMKEVVDSNEFVTLRGISGSFPVQGRRAVQAYAQSKSLVGFIIDRWGVESIERMLVAYGRGVSDAVAIRGSLAVSIEELEEQWLTSVGVTDPKLRVVSFEPSVSPDAVLLLKQPHDRRNWDFIGIEVIVAVSAAATVIGLSLIRIKRVKTRE